eukprot:13369340-Ditylum_brightwellii.AAC.1
MAYRGFTCGVPSTCSYDLIEHCLKYHIGTGRSPFSFIDIAHLLPKGMLRNQTQCHAVHVYSPGSLPVTSHPLFG